MAKLSADEAYAEALRRIEDTAASSVTRLILSDLGLTALPDEIWKLTALTKLDLFGNQLTALPDEIWKLTALTELNLSNNQLTALPAEIGKLTALTGLYLYKNRLTALPAEIGKLTALTVLDLGTNQLTALPAEIGKLTALTVLYLYKNRLTALPAEIGKLTALTKLDLFGNQLTALPDEIWKLTALTELNLSNNQLTALPAEIGKLTALTVLDLSNNQLTALPAEIGKLTALTVLDLGTNQLTALPAEIWKLTALTVLNLSNNQLTALPAEIGKLTALTGLDLTNNKLAELPTEISGLVALLEYLYLFSNQLAALPAEIRKLRALKRLYLHGNDALKIPVEVLGSGVRDSGKAADPTAILEFYFRLRESEKRPLNEIKVILVGQGGVGKTSLVKRMVFNTFDKAEGKTKGIYINKEWRVPGKKGKGSKAAADQVQVNFWDFGGQEIMHATHQFFLTRRTVYVLVLDARKGENESNIHYWLKIIRSYGGDSPVLVVTNKCDEHALELNETRLKMDYPNIQGFFQTSCEKGRGIKEVKDAIRGQVHSKAMRHVFDPLPTAYFEVKKKLEAEAAQKNFIDVRDYHALCQAHGVTKREEQDVLLRFLHDLGSVLSFNDPDSPYALREMSVLNPDWVLNRHEKTTEINRRIPPEGGVDLYWQAKKVAYQCKSVVDETGRFSVSKAVESIKSALELRKKLPWERYVVCSNAGITGSQEAKLREVLPEVELLTPSYWVPRCKEQSRHLEGRFRRLEGMGRG